MRRRNQGGSAAAIKAQSRAAKRARRHGRGWAYRGRADMASARLIR